MGLICTIITVTLLVDLIKNTLAMQVLLLSCAGAVLGPFTGRKLSTEEVIKLKLKSYWEVRNNDCIVCLGKPLKK